MADVDVVSLEAEDEMTCLVSLTAPVRQALPELPILLGGVGGYLPDNVTPVAWAHMAVGAAGYFRRRSARAPAPTARPMTGSITSMKIQ